MKFFTITLMKIWVLKTAFSSPRHLFCPVLRRRFDLKDNLCKFGSICLILYDFSGFYKILKKIKVFMPKYFVLDYDDGIFVKYNNTFLSEAPVDIHFSTSIFGSQIKF